MPDHAGELAAPNAEPEVGEDRRRAVALGDALDGDEFVGHRGKSLPPIPARAGIQVLGPWVAAFAGTSGVCGTLIALLRKRDEARCPREHQVEQHADNTNEKYCNNDICD